MKKLTLTLALILVAITTILAQVPQSFKYQAVVRDDEGGIQKNKLVSFRISILSDSPLGNTVYEETHYQYATNEFGIVTLNIGEGTVVSGNFSAIDWGTTTNYVKTELDINGGSSYEFIGTSQLLSVPYSFYAENATNINDADADSTNEIQAISLSNDTLYLSNGGSVYIGDYMDNTDSQTLTLINDTALSISNGNTIQLTAGVADADADPTNELQLLSISNDTLYLSNANYVVIPPDIDADTTNELQVLTLSGDTLFLSDGNYVIFPFDNDLDSINELQVLLLSNDTLYLSDGNYVILSDDDPINELQTLTINNDTLSISDGNSVLIPFDFSFPDGTQNIIPVTIDSLYDYPYTVPDGYNLYITNIYGNSIIIYIDSIAIFQGTSNFGNLSGNINFKQPFIVGSNQVISNGFNQVTYNGFLVTQHVIPITLKDLDVSPYTVPAGRKLYITNVYIHTEAGDDLLKIDNKMIARRCYNSDCINKLSLSIPIIINSGQTISAVSDGTGDNEVSINGYLK